MSKIQRNWQEHSPWLQTIFALDLVLSKGYREALGKPPIQSIGGFFSLGLPVVSAEQSFQSGLCFYCGISSAFLGPFFSAVEVKVYLWWEVGDILQNSAGVR